MTLVCKPEAIPMPFDTYDSPGVDVLYPSHIMNPPPFTDTDWSTTAAFEALPSSMPEFLSPPTYSAPHRPPPISLSAQPNNNLPFSRPKSSPSTFGPNVEDILFTDNPFKLRTEEFPAPMLALSPQPSSAISTRAPIISSPMYAASEYPASSTSQSPSYSHRPIPTSVPPEANLGGYSHNGGSLKRGRDESPEFNATKKRKRAVSNPGPAELNDEEQLLLKLKEDENLPWKDIAVRFQTDLGKAYQVPALQMRFKRLKERLRTWTDTDVQALEQAYDYWEKFQFDIIAAKMLDFGATERWPAKYCARKWDELHPGRPGMPMSAHSSNSLLRDPWEALSPVPSSIGHLSPRATM